MSNQAIQIMSVIIEHKESKERYILIGTGLGLYQSKKPSWFLGNIVADTEEGSVEALCACDENGEIYWFNAEEFKVVSIDGHSPSLYF